MNPDTATVQELADWCARDDGWNYEPPQVDGLGEQAEYWWRWTIGPEHGGRTYAHGHPFPPTLDGAAKAMPEGWLVTCTKRNWSAWSGLAYGVVDVKRTKDEILDRYSLGVKARLAAKGVQA